eukprot:m.132201 g.132201  ORF g.132201 m.132201 type:complete len:104 (+) comp13788_c0_seq2:2453-2764(+)
MGTQTRASDTVAVATIDQAIDLSPAAVPLHIAVLLHVDRREVVATDITMRAGVLRGLTRLVSMVAAQNDTWLGNRTAIAITRHSGKLISASVRDVSAPFLFYV